MFFARRALKDLKSDLVWRTINSKNLNFEFSLRGARFFTTILKKIEKIDLLLVFYCLDGFSAWFLAGVASVSTKACAAQALGASQFF